MKAALFATVTLMMPASLAAEGEAGANAINTRELIIKDGSLLSIEREPWVDETPLSQSSISKIGYGAAEFVNIVTTPTGTYSSDAIGSPYISYPGVHVTDLGVPWHWRARFLSDGLWVTLPLARHSSFVTIQSGDTRVFSNGGRTCVRTPTLWSC